MAYKPLNILAHLFVKNSMVLIVGVITASSLVMSASAFITIKSHPTLRPIPISYQTKKTTASAVTAVKSEPTSEKAVETTQSTSTQQPKANTGTTKRKEDSTNADWLACQAKLNDLYVTYEAEITRINQEKNAALAEVDRMYEDGELAYDPNGNPLTPDQQTATWQYAREILTNEYDDQLSTLNRDHQTKWDAQMTACNATFDH